MQFCIRQNLFSLLRKYLQSVSRLLNLLRSNSIVGIYILHLKQANSNSIDCILQLNLLAHNNT